MPKGNRRDGGIGKRKPTTIKVTAGKETTAKASGTVSDDDVNKKIMEWSKQASGNDDFIKQLETFGVERTKDLEKSVEQLKGGPREVDERLKQLARVMLELDAQYKPFYEDMGQQRKQFLDSLYGKSKEEQEEIVKAFKQKLSETSEKLVAQHYPESVNNQAYRYVLIGYVFVSLACCYGLYSWAGGVLSAVDRWSIAIASGMNRGLGEYNPAHQTTTAIQHAGMHRYDPIAAEYRQLDEAQRLFMLHEQIPEDTFWRRCSGALCGLNITTIITTNINKLKRALSSIHNFFLRNTAAFLYNREQKRRMEVIDKLFTSPKIDQPQYKSSRITGEKHAVARWQRELAKTVLVHAASA